MIDGLILGDCTSVLKEVNSESVHLILSDIPYGIGFEDWDVFHNNKNSAYGGKSPAQEDIKVFKRRGKPLNGWSEADKKIPQEYQEWCSTWASDIFRILVPGASAIIFAGRRYSSRCVVAMEEAGFLLKDQLAWLKVKAPHRAQRLSSVFERRGDMTNKIDMQGWKVGNLAPIFEPILWFIKPYKQGSTIADNMIKYGVGAYNEEVYKGIIGTHTNVISGIGIEKEEGGLHPTQKPLKLMEALILLTTKEGQTVVDPFSGSGTTLLAAKKLNRRYIGVEISKEYFEIAKHRLDV